MKEMTSPAGRPAVDLSSPVPARRSEAEIRDLIAERVLVLDGATGTGLQNRNLTAEDFGGPALEGCNESLVLYRPDVVADLHASYLEVGADIVETNTFGATSLVLAEYELQDRAIEINRLAAEIAKRTAGAWATEDRPRLVAGSIGPTTKAISVTGGVTFDGLIETFRDQAIGLVEGHADLLLVETQQDTRNVKAAFLGLEQAFASTGVRLPVMLSGTIEPTGTMLAGQGVEALWTSVSHFPLLSIGLNCATGPAFMTDHIRSLSELAKCFTSCVPNAGLPDENGNYSETPEKMAVVLQRFLDQRWVNVIGGCCGTSVEHIRAFAGLVPGATPRRPAEYRKTFVSGIDFLEATDDNRPLQIGERTNVIGSRRFKRLVSEERYEEAADIARRQVRGGAQIIDVNLQNPDRDELVDTDRFYSHLVRMIKAPIMIDSTLPEAVALALTWCQGKAIVNSINLEDGEDRFEKICPLVHDYGAAVVVGTIDEDPIQGMGVTRERKLEIARRSFQLLTGKYGIPAEDILWDPLVFPVGTGDQQYVGSAEETLAAIPLLKAEFPGTKTILGVSNVSFGLPTAGREVLNSVYLYLATKAGLDFAIVNTERLERYASLSEEEVRLSEDLLFNRGDDPIAAFAAHFRGHQRKAEADSGPPKSLDERLAGYVIDGSKDGLIEDLERKRAEGASPMDIINGPLMAGMAEVGRLFNDNRLIVAEVLQSAEAMKASVSHLEQYLEDSDVTTKGKMLLATVKGDVHDIGKNLVDIVLSNNGWEIINLGIKIPPETLIEACREHQPDVVGLSGLLVKSAQNMVTTAEDMKRAGISTPMLVGGAALSERFTVTRIAPAYSGPVLYAKDAMAGLALADRIQEDGAGLAQGQKDAQAAAVGREAARAKERTDFDPGETRSEAIQPADDVPEPPDLDRHVEQNQDLSKVWPWVNPQALYGRHLGLRGKWENLLQNEDPKAHELKELVEGLQREAEAGAMRARAVWQWFPVEARGNSLRVLDPAGQLREELPFQRQRKPNGLAVPDWVREAGTGPDWMCLFVTTMGEGIRDRATELKDAGEYLKSHALQALALEGAEAYAEWIHAEIRAAWGFPDAATLTMADRFRSRYRGLRVSFGYPACPELEHQEILWRLLQPDDIGVALTDGFMMDPEASVSALVFHHPQANYFSVGAG
ncbi:MAG: methionine synthase [Gemmatimonadota bacterium]|nr:MAG: methionine synthase [Gemmatimonadota bacterium]